MRFRTQGGSTVTIISISNTAKEKVHNFTLFTAELLLGVALGCAMWFGFGDKLTFTVETALPVSATQSTAEAKRDTPSFTVEEIPEPLQELFLRNPDALRFVVNYPTLRDQHAVIDLSDLSGTDSVPRLYQWDTRWGYESYNENYFALSGCGPTCLSMVDIYLTGHTDHSPLWMARFAEENGFNEVGNGSKWTLFSEGASLLGLQASGITLSYESVSETLASGTPIVCVMGPGDFTQHGHYLVLTGINADGSITLNDPNSRSRSERTWTFEQLRPQIRGGWAITTAKDNVN